MDLNLSFLLLLWTAPVFGSYVFVTKKQSWTAAQMDCEKNQTNLAVISSQSDLDLALKTVGMYSEMIWIGLKRNTQTSTGGGDERDRISSTTGSWIWTDNKEATTFFWAAKQPDSTQQECVAMLNGEWYDEMAESTYSFLCYSSGGSGSTGGTTETTTTAPETLPPTTAPPVDLVGKALTWEGALNYCKKTGKNLAVAKDDTTFKLIIQKLSKADVDTVWMGLHFFAGQWLWMDGLPVQSNELPSCPQPVMGCGALLREPNSPWVYKWTGQPCDKAFPFVCS